MSFLCQFKQENSAKFYRSAVVKGLNLNTKKYPIRTCNLIINLYYLLSQDDETQLVTDYLPKTLILINV